MSSSGALLLLSTAAAAAESVSSTGPPVLLDEYALRSSGPPSFSCPCCRPASTRVRWRYARGVERRGGRWEWLEALLVALLVGLGRVCRSIGMGQRLGGLGWRPLEMEVRVVG